MNADREIRHRTLASVAMAILLIVVMAAIRPGLDYRHVVTGVDENEFWLRKFESGPHYDFVMIGDSRVYMGLVPETLEQTLTGRKVLNFGFPGSGLGGEYLAHLPSLLEPSGCRTLVFSVTPSSLTRVAAQKNGYVSVAEKDGEEGVLMTDRLARWLDQLESHDRFAVISMIDLFGRLGPQSFTENMNFVRTHYHESGWVENEVSRLEPDASSQSYRTTFSNNTVKSSTVDYFVRQVALYASEGITVVGIRMPISPQLQEIERQYSGMDWSGFVSAFEAAGGLWLGSFVEAGFETFDGSHLTNAEARRFSELIAARLDGVTDCGQGAGRPFAAPARED